MEISVSNEIYRKLWDIMRKEGLDSNSLQIEYAIGKLIEKWETGRSRASRGKREYRYIHSSDLMMPGSSGPKNLWVVTRLMDTESWQRGEEMYWHTGIFSPTLQRARQMDRNYAKLLTSLTYSGYNPELSQIIAAGSHEGLGLLGGSHRLGYLLRRSENFFAPVKIFPTSFGIPAADKELQLPESESDRAARANISYEWLHARGIPFDKVENLRDRYEQLVAKLRRNVLCLVETSSFMARKKAVLEALAGVGRCIGVRMARAKMAKEKRLANLSDVDFCPPPEHSRVLGMDEFMVLDVELDCQDLYYAEERLGSFTVDAISRKLEEILGSDWGYMAPTVTESVMLEEKLFDMGANEGGMEPAPYAVDDVV